MGEAEGSSGSSVVRVGHENSISTSRAKADEYSVGYEISSYIHSIR